MLFLVARVTKMSVRTHDYTADVCTFFFWLRVFWLRFLVWLRFGYESITFGYVLVTVGRIWLRFDYARVLVTIWLRFGYGFLVTI